MNADGGRDGRGGRARAYRLIQLSIGRPRCLLVLLIIIGAAAAIAATSKTFGRTLKSKQCEQKA